ncbi:SIMPL domain-containing protein [Christiangramia sp. SM2212]|uniref:SIMPL domain-containing protein n=1 Tax=Christiangramia sediminicola TaxID=3073267 RepID=A0ABU1ERJ0_9FLAO|nr:SIMPL domain-containing protein [Christiangramia sp. SM2212]MDR5590604.1 SIMPL domain-containing protein [Christiangramia sp. SM2212]
MKKLLFVLTILLTIPALAQENSNRSIVNVTGEGVVKVEPDEVLIKSRIEHEGNSAAEVKRQNDEVVDKVIKYLKSQNIDEKDIKTEYVNLNKRYDYNDKTYSYVANQAISISLRDLKDYEKIMKGLLENGLNRIDGIQFKSSEMERYEKEARKLAVLDAQNRARELAQPLGQDIGKAVSISEMDYNSFQPVYRMDEAVEMSAAKGSQQTIAPGELEIKIKVNVGFELK